jgi:hypothetical protein
MTFDMHVKWRRARMTTAKTTEAHGHQTPREEHDTRSDRLELSERDEKADLEDEPTEQGVNLDPKRRID